jgi:ABC-type nitrate/sulfonate/bicarbonate transport system substrate-binding protein
VIVSTEDNLLIRGVDRSIPIKAVGSMMQYSGLGWIALKSSGIPTLADLKGKPVGIHGDGETGQKISMAQFGLTPEFEAELATALHHI